jgi:hypothetical protein
MAVDPTQATRVVDVLTRWCEQAPGRSFRLERTEDGWHARLDERRDSSGATAVDALSQIATCAAFETHAGEPLDEG